MTVVDGEKVVLQCCVTVAPTAEVTWYVDTSFTVRGLRAGTDHYFRVMAENGASQPLTHDHSLVPRTPLRQAVCAAGTSRSVRRDAIQRDALLARPDVERRSGDCGLRHRQRSATWPSGATANSASASKTSRSVRPTAIRSFSRPTADGHGDNWDSTCPSAQSLFDMPAVTFSFRFNNGHLTRMPEHQEHLHLDSVSIQLSVSIYIISASLLVFLL